MKFSFIWHIEEQAIVTYLALGNDSDVLLNPK